MGRLKTTFKKAAGVFIISEGSVILCKRIFEYKGEKIPYGGYWSPFAGVIEKGEDARDAAIRELKEESGVIANKNDLNYIDDITSPDRVFTIFALEVKKFPKIKLDFEHTDMGYFFIEYLQELPSDYKLDPEIVKSLQRYKNNIPKKD